MLHSKQLSNSFVQIHEDFAPQFELKLLRVIIRLYGKRLSLSLRGRDEDQNRCCFCEYEVLYWSQWNLIKTLQSRNMSEQLASMTTAVDINESFKLFWNKVLGVDEPDLPRTPQDMRLGVQRVILQLNILPGWFSNWNWSCQIYFEALDLIICGIQNRVYCKLQDLIKGLNKKDHKRNLTLSPNSRLRCTSFTWAVIFPTIQKHNVQSVLRWVPDSQKTLMSQVCKLNAGYEWMFIQHFA